MIPLQVISVIFAFFMMYVVRIHHKKQHLDALEFWCWISLWTAFGLTALFPQTFQGITETLHISRVFDLLVIVALMIVVFFTFQNRMYFKRLEKKLEHMIRERAMYANKRKISNH
ncbi:MAG: DUF2304 domain-containing protein [Candidatus Pacebacteria bacterium]|nr:DUF2304 domain-containing protein [Candidatus Paceibacterota bacterium]